MKNLRLLSLLRVCALAGLVWSFVAATSTCDAQNMSSLPQVIAKKGKGGRVVITVAPIGSDVTKVVIQRKVGSGKFVTVAVLNPTGGRARITDSSRSKKPRQYRAQFRRRSGDASLWSVESSAPVVEMSTEASGLAVSDCPAGFLDAVHFLANQARANLGVATLTWRAELTASAQAHANFMSWAQNLTHEGWMEEIAQTGYVGKLLGQNIASGFPTPESVIAGWLNSPGHRRNLLNPAFTEDGFGCMKDNNGGLWWVHNLGVS